VGDDFANKVLYIKSHLEYLYNGITTTVRFSPFM